VSFKEWRNKKIEYQRIYNYERMGISKKVNLVYKSYKSDTLKGVKIFNLFLPYLKKKRVFILLSQENSLQQKYERISYGFQQGNGWEETNHWWYLYTKPNKRKAIWNLNIINSRISAYSTNVTYETLSRL